MTEDTQDLARMDVAPLAALSQLSLPLEVRIGSASLRVGELMRIRAGSVVTLDRHLDEPVEVLVGERVVARAELVAVDDKIGVRITEILADPGGDS